ncbi:MAG: hypothetical protein Q7T82_05300 [Armatimonadota bacterium]|nr:hypothetical protein [Armatimonadota bacterium]
MKDSSPGKVVAVVVVVILAVGLAAWSIMKFTRPPGANLSNETITRGIHGPGYKPYVPPSQQPAQPR